MPTGDEALRARLNELFREELTEHLERLEHGLDELAAGLPEVSADVVGELFRSAHSLKGAATAVGATEISARCHHLEESLAQVRDGQVEVDRDLVDEMVRLTDLVAEAGGALRRETGRTRVDAPEVDPAGGGPQPPGADAGTVRLTSGRLDSLLSQAGDLITATYRSELLVSSWRQASEELAGEAEHWRRDREVLHRVLGRAVTQSPQVREVLERVDVRTRRTVVELERLARSTGSHESALRGMAAGFAESVRQVRMVPFTEATGGLARMVRDLCAEQGKQARLVVDAAEVEVDKQLVATLHDVLGHAVRNAVAHGIETPQRRAAAGKPHAGSVVVRAVLRTSGIEVVVTDDGGGIDVARVRRKAEELGLALAGGDTGLAEALFHPGLSTAAEVTEVSGRGVGLDAVRAAVDATGGTVGFRSTPGQGAELTVSLPLTLSSLRVVLVRVAGEVLAMPTAAVRRLVRNTAHRTRLGGHQVREVDGSVVPVVPLSRVLGWGDDAAPDQEPTGLLVTGAEGSVILLADDLVAEREVVLRTAPARLAGLNMLLGTAQLEDGSVSLVLSPSVCARAGLAGTPVSVEAAAEEETAPARVLLVEDTVTTRELERSILAGAGYDVAVAVDGQQAWEMLQTRDFDAVVSDVNMPRMDGIALCRAIRRSRRHPNLPVVLVTTLHSDADRRRGAEAGADAYLDKSGFDREELLATLERLL